MTRPLFSRPRVAVPALALAALMAGIAAPSARASGVYPVYFCAAGHGDSHANDLSVVGLADTGIYCNTDGSAYPYDGVYGISSTAAEADFTGVRATAPPGARLRSLSVNLTVPYQATNRRTFIEADGSYVFSWWNGRGGSSSYGGGYTTVGLSDATEFTIGQSCTGSAGACESGDFYFNQAVATLYDDTAPSLSVSGGGLFGGSFARGVTAVSASAADGGHGLVSGAVLVDGQPRVSVDWSSGCSERRLLSCPASADWNPSVDTRGISDGPHTFAVTVSDGMGNARTEGTKTVTVDNTAPSLGAVPSITSKTVSATEASVPLAASDATAGMDHIEASVDGSDYTAVAGGPAQGTVVAKGVGAHTVRYRAVDRAGNVSEVRAVPFTLVAPPTGAAVATTDHKPLPGPPGPGDVVLCDPGPGWSNGTSFTYQWLQDQGAPVETETRNTLLITSGLAYHDISCQYTAVNEAGSHSYVTGRVRAGGTPNFGQPAAPTTPSSPPPGAAGSSGSNGSNGSNGSGTIGKAGSAGPQGPAGAGGRPAPALPTLRNPSPSGPNGTHASDDAVVTASFVIGGGPKPKTTAGLVIPYKERPRVRGTLRTGAGLGIGLAQVFIAEKPPSADESTWHIVGSAVTRPDGSWETSLLPGGQTRNLRAVYFPTGGSNVNRASGPLSIYVRQDATLHASARHLRNGRTLRLSGRLYGVARRGATARVQVKMPTYWLTFARAKVASDGSFHVTHRFRATRKRTTYRFRTQVVPKSSRYTSGYSPEVKVVVSP